MTDDCKDNPNLAYFQRTKRKTVIMKQNTNCKPGSYTQDGQLVALLVAFLLLVIGLMVYGWMV